MTTNRCQHFSQKLDSLCYRIDVWRSARVVHRHEVLCHESVSRTHSGHETTTHVPDTSLLMPVSNIELQKLAP